MSDSKKLHKSVEAQEAEKLNARIIELLVIERTNSGMTLEEMGDKMGKLKSSIHRFEKGTYNLTLAKFLEICNILQLKPEEIIKRANS